MSLITDTAKQCAAIENEGTDEVMLLVSELNTAYYKVTQDASILPFTYESNGACWSIYYQDSHLIDSENLDYGDDEDEPKAVMLGRMVQKELLAMRDRITALAGEPTWAGPPASEDTDEVQHYFRCSKCSQTAKMDESEFNASGRPPCSGCVDASPMEAITEPEYRAIAWTK
jgi:hypothetical protein